MRPQPGSEGQRVRGSEGRRIGGSEERWSRGAVSRSLCSYVPLSLCSFRSAILSCFVLFVAGGCHTDMWTQPKALPQQASDVLPGGMVSQHPVEGTITYNGAKNDRMFYTGFSQTKLVPDLPKTLTINGETLDTKADLAKILARGKERFEIFCTHCHGALGDGKGMIARRGLELRRPPATYHTDRLRQIPIGHFYDVITKGYGAMYSYAYRVEPNDRWAIAAYIRVLQHSQNANAAEMPQEEMDKTTTKSGEGHG